MQWVELCAGRGIVRVDGPELLWVGVGYTLRYYLYQDVKWNLSYRTVHHGDLIDTI